MSRLESEPFKEFVIRKESEEIDSKFDLTNETDRVAGSPVTEVHRQQAIEKFDSETAQADCEALVAKSSNSEIDSYLNNAALLLKSGDFKLAQNILRAVLKKDPTNEMALKGLGESFVELNELESALEVYLELAPLHPRFEHHCNIGDIYYRMAKDSAAAHWYYKALESPHSDSPQLFDVFKNLGNISVRMGDLESAEENYNKAFTLNPDSDTLLVNFGTLEIQRGNFEEALSRFRQAATINCTNEKAWVGLAMIHREHGDHDLSWANIEKALDIDPVNETAMRLIVDWAFRDNRLNDGIRQLEIYLEKKSDDHEMRMILAQFFLALARYKHAREQVHLLEEAGITNAELKELSRLIEGALS